MGSDVYLVCMIIVMNLEGANAFFFLICLVVLGALISKTKLFLFVFINVAGVCAYLKWAPCCSATRAETSTHEQMHENSLYNAKSIKEKVVKVCQQSKFALGQIIPTKFASNQTIYYTTNSKALAEH